MLTNLGKNIQQGQVCAADVKVFAIIHSLLSYMAYVVRVSLLAAPILFYGEGIPNEVIQILSQEKLR